MNFPLFYKPDEYLEKREGKFFFKVWLKRWFERRALERCLDQTEKVTSICDVPCGPGRLFDIWKSKDWRVTGLDLSDDMVEAAESRRNQLQINGLVRKVDVFSQSDSIEKSDLVTCVRFAYYFDGVRRIELLQSLAKLTNRYILVQYKSKETLRGRKTFQRRKDSGAYTKHYVTAEQIREEILQAGLTFMAFNEISQSSDRVFALARIDS